MILAAPLAFIAIALIADWSDVADWLLAHQLVLGLALTLAAIGILVSVERHRP